MSPIILDGKKLSNKIKEDLEEKIRLNNKKPGLGIILVGQRPDSQVYVRMKKKACVKAGIKNFDVHLEETVSEETVIEEIEKMNNNPEIDAILVQLPLPVILMKKRY